MGEIDWIRQLLPIVQKRYGTHRGFVRSYLSMFKYWLGVYEPYQKVDWKRVERLVFVCQGNICRSPYAHFRALQSIKQVASVGLSTTSGQPANSVAQTIAHHRGIDLSGHLVTAIEDFFAKPTDFFLVMEDRHIPLLRNALLKKGLELTNIQIGLLGLWGTPKNPLIYDPFNMSEEYFHTCFSLIDSAVLNLIRLFSNKATSPTQGRSSSPISQP